MADSQPKLALAEMQAAHRRHGTGFLDAIAQMPAQQQEDWVRAQGYARVQDLLAHMVAWYDEAVRLVPRMLSGEKAPFGYKSVDAFNAVATERYRDHTRAQVEVEYVRARDAFDALLAGLSPEALEHERAYEWLYLTGVEHYEEHRLP